MSHWETRNSGFNNDASNISECFSRYTAQTKAFKDSNIDTRAKYELLLELQMHEQYMLSK